MLAKLQEQFHRLLQTLGVGTLQPQPVRISQAEQERLRRKARGRR
jgi:hypothetical protein